MAVLLRRATLTLVLAAGMAGCATQSPPRTIADPHLYQTSAAPTSVLQLQKDLSTIFNAPVMRRGIWGVDVRSVDTGAAFFMLNPDRLMMPASNMKVLTLAAAAQSLGWDHRFTTVLETTAPVEGGVLRGDLIVRGTGDPTINTRANRSAAVFDEWAQALRAAGVTAVEGRIVGHDQAFDDEGIGPGWAWDYLDAGYAAPIGALQFNENVAELSVSPGASVGEAVLVRLAPGTGLTLINRATTAPLAAEGARVAVHRRIDRQELEISGRMAIDAKPLSRTVAVLNPTVFFAQGVKDALTARGIAVSGMAVDGDDVGDVAVQAEPKTLVTTRSAPLREIATVLMKVSQNQYAETLLKAIGAKAGVPGTTDSGRATAIETFTAWNIPRDGYVMSDGSGLSRYNYIAPTTMTAVLRRMHADPAHRDAFLATLPIAAKDGTISTRMRRSRAADNARAKTGSISNVRALSGFVTTRDGETLVFAIMANDFVIPSAVVDWIADLAVETLANFTRR
ncbi:MAG TPA: D-alanyl-D-alanine carboxypeptidase/D-alanyl-D-alanine-endopeptidase [Vicinamibacterales bacterium]|nr:D-alanyl-D-alanine carboxypeptidase/D-alanyl-D-alanine-endopeptidase [Vicinamibacterales bacterium]